MQIMAIKDVCFIDEGVEREWLACLSGFSISCPEFGRSDDQESVGGMQSDIWGGHVPSNIETGGRNRYDLRNKFYLGGPGSGYLSQMSALFFKNIHEHRKGDFFSMSGSFLESSKNSVKLRCDVVSKPSMQAERLSIRKIMDEEYIYLFERSRQRWSDKFADESPQSNHCFSGKNARRITRGQSSSPSVSP